MQGSHGPRNSNYSLLGLVEERHVIILLSQLGKSRHRHMMSLVTWTRSQSVLEDTIVLFVHPCGNCLHFHNFSFMENVT